MTECSFRMRAGRWSCGALLAVAAAACAQRDSAPSLPPPPLASPGPVSPDGVYAGVMQSVRGGMMCGDDDTFSITVRGGAFRYVLYQPQVPEARSRTFEVTIGPNGSFETRDGPTFIRGTVSGGHMQGVISGDACGWGFQADRTGTF